jgi:hypothetical protein
MLLQLAKSRPNDLEITEKHIRRLFDHFRRGEALEVYDVIDRLQLDVVTDIFYGESTNSLVQKEQPFRDAMDTLLRLASVRTILGYVAFLNKHSAQGQKHADEYSQPVCWPFPRLDFCPKGV